MAASIIAPDNRPATRYLRGLIIMFPIQAVKKTLALSNRQDGL